MNDPSVMTWTEIDAVSNYQILPHPDGKTWMKCCTSDEKDLRADNIRIAKAGTSDTQTSCQCFMKKPPSGKSRFEASLKEDGTSNFYKITELLQEKGRFFCCHRLTEDGFHRECAGWAAKITKNR